MQPSNILKIESLDEGWCDKDHVLLHACFQLLSDFVEKEMLPLSKYIDWNASSDFAGKQMLLQDDPDSNSPEEKKNPRQEIEELYAWWQQRKDDKIMDRSSSFEEDHTLYLMDNEMLKRLIDVRMHLWT